MSGKKWVLPAWEGPESPQSPVPVSDPAPSPATQAYFAATAADGAFDHQRDAYEQGYNDGAAAERARIRQLLLGCTTCGEIHVRHRATSTSKSGPYEHDTWAAPDGHTYSQRWRTETFAGRDIADLLDGAS